MMEKQDEQKPTSKESSSLDTDNTATRVGYRTVRTAMTATGCSVEGVSTRTTAQLTGKLRDDRRT